MKRGIAAETFDAAKQLSSRFDEVAPKQLRREIADYLAQYPHPPIAGTGAPHPLESGALKFFEWEPITRKLSSRQGEAGFSTIPIRDLVSMEIGGKTYRFVNPAELAHIEQALQAGDKELLPAALKALREHARSPRLKPEYRTPTEPVRPLPPQGTLQPGTGGLNPSAIDPWAAANLRRTATRAIQAGLYGSGLGMAAGGGIQGAINYGVATAIRMMGAPKIRQVLAPLAVKGLSPASEHQVLEALTHELNYNSAMVSMFDPGDQTVQHIRLIGGPPEVETFAQSCRIPITDPDSPEGTVVLQGQPLLVKDIEIIRHRLHPLNQRLAELSKTKALVVVPIKTKDRIWGMLTVDRSHNQTVTDDDRELMTTVASQVSIALDNASAYQQIEEWNEGLEVKVKERTEALGQADRLRAQFLSHVSHELRTPLTSIKGFIQNLLDGLTGPLNEKQQRYLVRMSEKIVRRPIALSNDAGSP